MKTDKNTTTATGTAATKVPAGTFQVSIQDLQNQVRSNRVQAGPNGLQQAGETNDWASTKVPKGTFHESDKDIREREREWIKSGQHILSNQKDWKCPNCGQVNPMRNAVGTVHACSKCGAENPYTK